MDCKVRQCTCQWLQSWQVKLMTSCPPLLGFYWVTSWHGNDFHIAVPLWGESIHRRWIPLTQGASDEELCCFHYCWKTTQAFKQRVKWLMFWGRMMLTVMVYRSGKIFTPRQNCVVCFNIEILFYQFRNSSLEMEWVQGVYRANMGPPWANGTQSNKSGFWF